MARHPYNQILMYLSRIYLLQAARAAKKKYLKRLIIKLDDYRIMLLSRVIEVEKGTIEEDCSNV